MRTDANPPRPLTYLITGGRLTSDTTPADEAFARAVEHVRRAARAGVRLVQLREKQISSRVLYELARACVRATRDTGTRLLINDRIDVALAARADGVHLTRRSIESRIARELGGDAFLIGVSAHDLHEATAARDGGADFATFSPVYATESKAHLDLPPVGMEALHEASTRLDPFPLVALGGITPERAGETFRHGAAGVAGIRLFDADQDLPATFAAIEKAYERRHEDHG